MKKIFTLIAMAFMALSAGAQKEWNFSNWEGETISATKTVDGLTVYASSAESVTIDNNNKTVDDVSYTKRLKLGGVGVFDGTTNLPSARVLEFTVDGACSIYVAAMASSSSATDRDLVASAGTKENVIGTFRVDGAKLTSYTYNYTGTGAAKIYIYSIKSGINVYDIKVTGTSGIDNITATVENADAPVYNLAGQRVSKDTKGILIQNGKKFVVK